MHVIAYSQGGLVLRSALYYSKERGSAMYEKLSKVFFVSTPHSGTYIEKTAFWLNIFLQVSPALPLKVLGFVTNFRTDAMKDLSHGLIRERDWTHPNYLLRYRQDLYFGELDDIDAYGIYSHIGEVEDGLQAFFGDGIVEKNSLEAMDKILKQKPGGDSRILIIGSASHLKILNAPELVRFIESKLTSE